MNAVEAASDSQGWPCRLPQDLLRDLPLAQRSANVQTP
jgi:hypothetical protein